MTLTPEKMKLYMREYRKRPNWTAYISKYHSDRVKMNAINKRYRTKLRESNPLESKAIHRYHHITKKGMDKVNSEVIILEKVVTKLQRYIREQGLSKDVLSKLRQS